MANDACGEDCQGLSLKTIDIAYGNLSFEVHAARTIIKVMCNDVYDPFVDLVKFVDNIPHGGDQKLTIFSGKSPAIEFGLQDGPTSGQCRLIIKGAEPGDHVPAISITGERSVLQGTFKAFLSDVADHAYFAHMWVCFMGCGTDGEAVLTKAESLWKQGVKDGKWTEDFDAQEEFGARYFVENYKLTGDEEQHVIAYRKMLTNLIVPKGWK